MSLVGAIITETTDSKSMYYHGGEDGGPHSFRDELQPRIILAAVSASLRPATQGQKSHAVLRSRRNCFAS